MTSQHHLPETTCVSTNRELFRPSANTGNPQYDFYTHYSNGKLRPLGIPVVHDRCLQAMVKNALEPFWEAKFEAISYGFRPGRSCHDAIARIFNFANPTGRKEWILDADLKGAFDNISHDFLLATITATPGRELIKQWLKAGCMEAGVFQATETGTPQGGVISPLLANIALHGMEQALAVRKTLWNGRVIESSTDGVHYRMGNNGIPVNRGKRAVVRYADDFVVFCETKEDAEQSRQALTEWLKVRGLTLSEEKTRIVHISAGFDFLGFNVRQYKSPKTRKRGWKLLIKPSKQSVTEIRKKLRASWRSLQGQNVKAVLAHLNPVIRGWANYFRIGVAKETCAKLDQWMFLRELRYVRRTHPTKPSYWRNKRYWGRLNLDRNDNWVFGDQQTGYHVPKFRWFPIERHIPVISNYSPDDARLRGYWTAREKAKARNLKPSLQKVAHRQKGMCRVCGESLFNGEEVHVHHQVHRKDGGKDTLRNFQLLHLFCHQQVHAHAREQMTKHESVRYAAS